MFFFSLSLCLRSKYFKIRNAESITASQYYILLGRSTYRLKRPSAQLNNTGLTVDVKVDTGHGIPMTS